MADTVNLMGNKVPKAVAYGGAGVAGLAAIYFYRTKKQKQDAQASVDAAGSTDIDPATGYPYGSPEDAASLANQNNYQMAGGSGIGGGYGFTGYAGGSGSGVFGTGTPGSFNSNAEWAQYVESYEINNMGADAPTVGNAIGKYLTGQALTTDQVGIVQSAIAIAGYPPVNGPNGNPPSYVTGTTGNTNPPPPPDGNPGPAGPPGPPGPSGTIPASPIDGLRLVKKTATSFTVAWNSSYAPKGYSYRVEQMNAKIVKQAVTTAHQVTVSGLHSGWTYNFGIQGLPGGPGKNLHVQL
jgi:hypothetical protein